MDINAAFPSKYLKAADLGQAEHTLTLRSVELENVGTEDRPEHKPVAYFMEVDKAMVLNKTNAETLSHLHGSETDHWLGKQVVLFPMMVQFNNQPVAAIRLRGVTPPATTPLGQPASITTRQVPTPPTSPFAPGGPLPPGDIDESSL